MAGFFLFGNWKMHFEVARGREFAGRIAQTATDDSIRVTLFVPAPHLVECAAALEGSSVELGGQNIHEADEGAFTGEISARMVKSAGATAVLVGHSERRRLFGEGDQQVAAKLRAALAAGLLPVLCVGETLAERDAGHTEQVVTRQIAAACAGYDAVMPVLGEVAQPLCAGYRRSALAVIQDQLDAGDGRIRRIMETLRGRFLAEAELAAYDPELESFTNVNRREDLARVERVLAERDAARREE